MPNWPPTGFKSLTPNDRENLPEINVREIEQYVLIRQGLDRSENGDSSSLAKARAMKDNVTALSMVRESGRSFFTGLVRSSMKKVIPNFIGYSISCTN